MRTQHTYSQKSHSRTERPASRGVMIGLLSSFALVGATPSLAQISSSAEAPEISAVFACRAETDAMKRLACYDQAVGQFEVAQEQGEIVTITKKQVEEVRKDSFGFNIPSLPSLGGLFGGRKKAKVKTNAENDLTASTVETATIKTAPANTVPSTADTAIATQPEEQMAAIVEKKVQKAPKPAVEESGEIKEITVNIQRVQTFGRDKIRLFLENGQVWEQIDSGRVRIPKIRNGTPNSVTIRKASLGSFLMKINGKGKSVRVNRVR